MGSFNDKDARDLLGLFLFSGEDVEKTVGSLSGGERNRLLLAKLVSQKANMLILDEPTNHLDIESREVLEASLADFPGTMLVVSHDRYFLRRIVNRIFIMSPSGITQFTGSYAEYQEHLEKIRSQLEEEKIKQAEKRKEKKPPVRPDEIRRQEARRKQQIAELENAIIALEEEKSLLEEQMADGETYQDGDTARQAVSRYEKVQQKLHELYMEWEKWHENHSSE
jgi:ATP-binding cassette subfamily F protein 3